MPVKNNLLTQHKSCSAHLYSYTVIIPQPSKTHSSFLISHFIAAGTHQNLLDRPDFYGFEFKVFSTPQLSLLSKVYLPWLSHVLQKWDIFPFSRRAVVIADKQTLSRMNFISTARSLNEQEWIDDSTCAGTCKPSIWKAFPYLVQHKAIPCSNCRKLEHLFK